MVLEVVTILFLAVVILAKYLTSKLTFRLTMRHAEADNASRRHQARYRKVSRDREVAENEEKSLLKQQTDIQERLQQLGEELSEQQQRNQELDGTN